MAAMAGCIMAVQASQQLLLCYQKLTPDAQSFVRGLPRTSGSMSKVPLAGEDHRNAVLVRGGDDFAVTQ